MVSFTLTPTNFGFGGESRMFSAQDPNNLGATSYTLIHFLVDCSSSVFPFKDSLKAAVAAAILGAGRSPEAANMMLRFTTFADNVREVFGFKELGDVVDKDYNNAINPNGCTSLNDAIVDACAVTQAYAKTLVEKGFTTNCVFFVLTDGEENVSKTTVSDVQKALGSLKDAKINQEVRVVESVQSVLIGVNVDPSTGTSNGLDNYKNTAGLDHYIPAGDASPANLAKIAKFVRSQSISQSRALGTGKPSQLLSF